MATQRRATIFAFRLSSRFCFRSRFRETVKRQSHLPERLFQLIFSIYDSQTALRVYEEMHDREELSFFELLARKFPQLANSIQFVIQLADNWPTRQKVSHLLDGCSEAALELLFQVLLATVAPRLD